MILDCSKCAALVNAEPVDGYTIFGQEGDLDRLVQLLHCPRCREPFLVQREQTGPEEYSEAERLFPSDASRVPYLLPRPIKVAFDEAGACLRARAYTAAAIMCRKTVEGVCAHHGAGEKTLMANLRALRDREVVDKRLFEWADELRLVGNEAVHDLGVTVSAEDARDAVEFTAALLEYLFTFRERFDRFKKRRADARGVAGVDGA